MDRQHHTPDQYKPAAQELQRFEGDFMLAVRRAAQTVESRRRRRSVLGRYVAGIIVAALLAGVVPLLLWRSPPVVDDGAELIAATSVQVRDRRTGQAIPGAEVILSRRSPQAARSGSYGQACAGESTTWSAAWTVAVTNAFGAFQLAAPRRSAGYEYVVLLGGAELARVSADSVLGGNNRGVIWLDGEQVADSLSYSGSVRLAGRVPVGGEISLQAAEGTAGWDGTVYRDLSWPTVFNYGKVLDGIFRVASTGDPNKPVEVSVRVSRGKLLYFQAGPADLRLITYSEQYAREDDVQRRFAHRGWYIADRPPAVPAGLEQVEYTVEPLADGCSVSWLARPGSRYALLAVPRADGANFMRCNVFRQSDAGGGNWSRQVVFGGSTLHQYRLFDAILDRAGLGQIVLNPLLQHPTLHYDLEQFNQTRDSGGGWPALLDGDSSLRTAAADPAGASLLIRYYDFTLSEFAQSDPLDIELKPAAGEYRIDYDPATRRLRLTGDLARVVAPPDWDFFLDGTVDARGFEAEIQAAAGQQASAAATFYEDQGSQVRVETSWVQPAPWLAGACNGVPLIHTQRTEPGAGAVTAQTPEVSFPPYPAGIFCGGTLGPLHLILDDTLAGQPLSSAEIVLYVTPLQGDTSLIDPVDNQYIYFDPLLAVIAPGEELLGVRQYAGQPAFPGHPAYYNLDLLNTSIDVYRALRAAEGGGSARDYLGGMADEVRRSAFSIGLGLDLGNLPPEQELLPVLRRFTQGEYFTLERITEQRQKVSWKIDLSGVVLKPGQSLAAGAVVQTSGGLFNGQWELMSGAGSPARLTITMANGGSVVRYFDFSPYREVNGE